MPLSIDAFNWRSSNWQPASKGLFSYSQFAPISSPNQRMNNAIDIYPIPFNDHIIIKGLDKGLLVMFNISGHITIKKQITSDLQRLNTHLLPSGSYIIKAQNSVGQLFMKKAVKR